jgi:NDP-sugar pyrophosphorylase family protein
MEKRNPFRSREQSLSEIPAVILAGGFGTRLRSVVSDRPKSMATIDGRPFLEYLLTWLRDYGIRNVVLCVGFGAEKILEHFGKGTDFDVCLRYSHEAEALGTAGALKQAGGYLNDGRFLALNGDSALGVDLAALLAEHYRHQVIGTVALAQSKEPGRFGRVDRDPSGMISCFAEKQAPAPQALSQHWISGGVYVFEREVLDLIPQAPPPVSLETDLMPTLIGHGLYGYPSEGYFIDIGVPDDYRRAQEELPRRFCRVHSHSR